MIYTYAILLVDNGVVVEVSAQPVAGDPIKVTGWDTFTALNRFGQLGYRLTHWLPSKRSGQVWFMLERATERDRG